MTESKKELQAKLNRETAVIKWAELQRHFARGDIIVVNPALDLIEAAINITQDKTDSLLSGQVRRAEDSDAHDWLERDPTLWAVVVAPWILVQEKQPQETK